MSSAQLVALAPLIALASTVVLVLAAISVKRHHGATFGLTTFGLLTTLATLPGAYVLAPTQVTPLFLIDRYALFFIGLITLATLVTALLSYVYMRGREIRHEEYYLLLLITSLGGAALAAAVHLGSLFLALETTSVGLFTLVAYRRDALRPIEAAIKYLVLVGVSTAILTFGLALFYAATGALAFAEIAAASAQLDAGNPILLGAYALIIAGVGFKLSFVPFHLWTPDVYQGAPTPVTAYLATVSKGAVFAVLFRLVHDTTGGSPGSELIVIISVVAIASMLIGNWLALLQDNIKRLLAFSSIAHMGYLLVPLAAGGELALEAAAFYFAAYFLTTLGAFTVVTIISRGEDNHLEQVSDYQGLFWRRPWLAGSFSIMLISLAGIPLTAGFPAKFYALAAGVGDQLWLLSLTLVVGSAIGLFYYLRVIIVMAGSGETRETGQAAPVSIATLLAVLTFAVIALGVLPGVAIGLISG